MNIRSFSFACVKWNEGSAKFQRVQVMEATVSNQWRIGLPNGVSVAFAGEVDTQALTAILHSAASVE